MSDETGNGVSVLHSVSGCYAEVHISWENIDSMDSSMDRMSDLSGMLSMDGFFTCMDILAL